MLVFFSHLLSFVIWGASCLETFEGLSELEGSICAHQIPFSHCCTYFRAVTNSRHHVIL